MWWVISWISWSTRVFSSQPSVAFSAASWELSKYSPNASLVEFPLPPPLPFCLSLPLPLPWPFWLLPFPSWLSLSPSPWPAPPLCCCCCWATSINIENTFSRNQCSSSLNLMPWVSCLNFDLLGNSLSNCITSCLWVFKTERWFSSNEM